MSILINLIAPGSKFWYLFAKLCCKLLSSSEWGLCLIIFWRFRLWKWCLVILIMVLFVLGKELVQFFYWFLWNNQSHLPFAYQVGFADSFVNLILSCDLKQFPTVLWVLSVLKHFLTVLMLQYWALLLWLNYLILFLHWFYILISVLLYQFFLNPRLDFRDQLFQGKLLCKLKSIFVLLIFQLWIRPVFDQ